MHRFFRAILAIFGGITLLFSVLLMGLRLQPPSSPWLAFHSERDGWYDIFRMNPNGEHLERLTYTQEVDTEPAWSPTSQQIAYVTSTYHDKLIQIINLVKNTITTLPYTDSHPLFLNWSPDGQWLAFNSDHVMNQEIYRYQIRGESAPQPLTRSFGSDIAPDWSADGKKMIFASGRNMDWELYLLDLEAIPVCQQAICDAPDAQRLTAQPGYNADPVFSPDGGWIAYTGFVDEYFQIFRMRADGTQVQQITSGAANHYLPDWSADSRWLAFVSDQDGNEEIYKIRADGTDLQRMTHNLTVDSAPVWSPRISLPWREWLVLLLAFGGLLLTRKIPVSG